MLEHFLGIGFPSKQEPVRKELPSLFLFLFQFIPPNRRHRTDTVGAFEHPAKKEDGRRPTPTQRTPSPGNPVNGMRQRRPEGTGAREPRGGNRGRNEPGQ